MNILNDIIEVVKERKANPKEGSYTNYLFDEGINKILKKVGEENAEVIIASKDRDQDEAAYEIADLMYHLTVLLVELDMDWSMVEEKLKERR